MNKEKIKQYIPYIIIYIVIFILLLLQHMNVSMYFDDFGNASLSYAKTIENVNGTDFTLGQVFENAVYTYNNFGGRVLYGIFATLLLKDGITLFMIMQTIVLILIVANIHSIITFYLKKNSIIIPIALFILYSIFHITILNNGLYWASASILYLWPLLPLFTYINYYIRILDKIKKKEKINYLIFSLISILLIALIVFSQEQIGVAFIVFIFIYSFFDHFKTYKKYIKYDLLIIVTSIITYLLLFLAPGNWARMASKNASFYEMSFFGKIFDSLPRIAQLLFEVKTNKFICILCFLIILFLLYKLIKNIKKNKLLLLLIIPVIGNILGIYLSVTKYNDNLITQIISYYSIFSIFIGLVVYYYEKKDLKMLAFPLFAAASIFCLLLSPYIVERNIIPCIFMLFITIILIGYDLFLINNKYIKSILIICFIIISLYGINNYRRILIGYYNNKNINDMNYNKLSNYKKYIDSNNKLKLCKVKDSLYSSAQPYDVDYDYWILQYFDINEEIEFEWNDCK